MAASNPRYAQHWLLPAPLTHRHNLDDPTDLFDGMATPGARLRLGVAHGSIRDFGTQGETKNQIAPDRARRSNLDYLALGDWHGTLKVDARTWYSGTPETDRFQRDEPGHILLVDVDEDREPIVTPIPTGRFQWMRRSWTVNDQAAFDAECDQLLGSIDPPATLLDLSLAGITSLTDRVAMLSRLTGETAGILLDGEPVTPGELTLTGNSYFRFGEAELVVMPPAGAASAEEALSSALTKQRSALAELGVADLTAARSRNDAARDERTCSFFGRDTRSAS